MSAITIRNLPEKVLERLGEVARANHRDSEAHVRFLIEREVAAAPADACGELAERIWAEPAPDDRMLLATGRRLGENDNWIAGFALYYQETVISHDTAFDGIEGVRRVVYSQPKTPGPSASRH